MSTALVWFRRDLRLADNPAFAAALESGKKLLAIYIHAPEEQAPWAPGGASKSWLHHSLNALGEALSVRGQRLWLFDGPSLETLERLIRAADVSAVYWNRCYEPALMARDKVIKTALRQLGVEVSSFNGALLHEPWEIKTGGGTPYRVFTPYWRNCRERLSLPLSTAVPSQLPPSPQLTGEIALDALGLLPAQRWDNGFYGAHSTPGEAGAAAMWSRFLVDRLARYKDGRDRPDLQLTSLLSSALHFGEIAVARLASEALATAASSGVEGVLTQAEAFVRELGWRDFSYHLMYHYPHVIGANLNPQFDRFEWQWGPSEALRRWQRGQTGFPIVDAGMRELWHTGFMHNRVRMIVASFLTKNLNIHWLEGARWFWDTLTDADLASNTQGWQWSAGSGADAQPYFRIFNPVSQGEKFDPEGIYVRHWVKELKQVPIRSLHAPWTAPRSTHPDYPMPMVDLKISRERALAAYQHMRTG